VNYERNKKGARFFFETQCSGVTRRRPQRTVSQLRHLVFTRVNKTRIYG